MIRALRRPIALMLFGSVVVSAQASPAPEWRAAADCATGFQVVWNQRPPGVVSMRDMTDRAQMEANAYKSAAMRFYLDEAGGPPDAARREIESHIAANAARFEALYRDGTIYDFLNVCPKIEELRN